MKEKRESRDLAYSGTRSKVRGNMKSIERASRSPVKKIYPEQSMVDSLGLEKSIEVTNLSVIIKGNMSPVRLAKDP